MSITIRKTIESALRKIRVLDMYSTADATQITLGIDALNGMMQTWEANGIAVGWVPVASANDLLPGPLEAQNPIIYNLAIRLRPDYGATLDPDVIELAKEGVSMLRALGANAEYNRIEYDDLPSGDSQSVGGGWREAFSR